MSTHQGADHAARYAIGANLFHSCKRWLLHHLEVPTRGGIGPNRVAADSVALSSALVKEQKLRLCLNPVS